MRSRRRDFFREMAAAGLSAMGGSSGARPAQDNSDPEAEAGGAKNLQSAMQASVPRVAHFPRVLVNHIGFRPEAGKYLVVDGVKGAQGFALVNMREKKGFDPSFAGSLVPAGTELGQFLLGDFSEVKQPGVYRIHVRGNYPFAAQFGTAEIWTHDFRIGTDVWDGPIAKLVNYYRAQSCGASKHGYNTPCHTGPIRRDDGAPAVPVTGGWHAADDCQRDVTEILFGALGLAYLALARPDLETASGLFGEIRWGNDYFLTIQSPDGFLYSGVEANEYFKWKEKDWWDSSSFILKTNPAAPYLQYSFMLLQALIAILYRGREPDYASRCLEAGKRCFEFVRKAPHRAWAPETMTYDLGSGILAGLHLFRAAGEQQYRDFAKEMANRLVSLQTSDGYWTEKSPSVSEAVLYTPLAPIGLCTAARDLSGDSDQPPWREALEKFAASFVKHFSRANAFGILPCRIFLDRPPQKARAWNAQHYRYFIETNYSAETEWSGYKFFWQTGNIANVAGYGVAMVYSAEILGLPWLRKLAERQLDWILGVNPFDASMILGVGRNQPPTYPSKEMIPPVPDIEGAVFEGPIGDEEDNPTILPGYYPTCEYWMPHQAWALWLMAELSADHSSGP